jgi:hypothetical protein
MKRPFLERQANQHDTETVTAAYTHAAENALLDGNSLSFRPSLSTSVNKKSPL